MVVVDFEDFIGFRIKAEVMNEIERIVALNPMIWDSKSQFCRSAVNYFLKKILDGDFAFGDIKV